MNILMVLTSHSAMGDSGKLTGLWLEEFVSPYYSFLDNGAAITLASPAGGHPPIDPRSTEPDSQTDATRRFQQDAAAQAKLAHTSPLPAISADDFDALFFPGGHGPMWDLASSEAVARLVEAFWNQGKVIGAVCHGPAALVQAKDSQGNSILNGRSLTAFTNAEEAAVQLDHLVPFALESRLVDLGGRFSQAEPFQPHVVTDGNLITGQNPPSSEQTAEAVLAALNRVPA
ncbi:Peptidase C56, PfpI [Halomicronema hongdechloris C2206]|uniref:Peptidase C56, PfpI n=1 Tax=Halomicronema hongdechloris C2206 TaxID=1641165 RepID=A0A1Z3HUL5_9CYAN|nr:type 1 glutamine amidotransferase domain-containing protein [Halomicronema hongdechloris]ASC74011.1 Peptidase C56, PfpI [Halomicronema hongdechloris C2206]